MICLPNHRSNNHSVGTCASLSSKKIESEHLISLLETTCFNEMSKILSSLEEGQLNLLEMKRICENRGPCTTGIGVSRRRWDTKYCDLYVTVVAW
jgi:hypothetical protein